MSSTLILLPHTTSTNLTLSEQHPVPFTGCGTAVATFHQTAGRGQRGNTWVSEPGKNVHYSLLYRPENIPSNNQFILSEAVSLVARNLLGEQADDVVIKWPNDLYRKGQKMGGILIENQLKGGVVEQSIIGIGLNINQIDFPAFQPEATSLALATGKTFDLETLVNRLHQQLCKSLDDLSFEKAEDIQRFYLNNLHRRDGFHPYSDKEGVFTAKIRGVKPQGDLLLEREDGTVKAYGFKEVTFLP
jgi:BirA family biotin operon repressor/biotin-[acetyl-CoA-carboxylase] ligase